MALERRGAQRMAAIVLCGGKGTRMGSSTTHKVCFPIAGTPAIVRAVETYRQEGFTSVLLVVGAMAGQVVQTVGTAFPDVTFVYQPEQRGTGHAARIGAEPLERLGFAGAILVTMGDKVVEPAVLRELVAHYHRTGADLVLATLPKRRDETSGRVVQDADGNVLGDVESRDIQRLRILERFAREGRRKGTLSGRALRSIALSQIPNPDKAAAALGEIWRLIDSDGPVEPAALAARLPESPGRLQLAGRWLSADQIEAQSPTINPSVYLFRPAALFEGLASLSARNAQGEEYLTDAIEHLASAKDAAGRPRFKIAPLPLGDEKLVMAFNNPEELLRIEDHVRRRRRRRPAAGRIAVRLPARIARPAAQWLELLAGGAPRLRRALRRIYGGDERLLAERTAAYQRVLRLFVRRYGADRRVLLARAPGRINLMGRHVGEHGGHNNVMAIDKEVIFAASPRTDDRVRLVNTDRRGFPAGEFRTGEQIAALEWDDWLTFIDSARVRRMVAANEGDWTNYVKAAVLRLQQQFRDLVMCGMDCAVTGNVPMGAGLSSGSALIVAAATAATAANRLDVTARQLVSLCDEGQWFVGGPRRRGEHAAIRFSRRGQVAAVRFAPFEVERVVDFPDRWRLVVCNSHQSAEDPAAAEDHFRRLAATAELGVMLLKDRLPTYAHRIELLRDVSAERLGIKPAALYRMLMRLPTAIDRRELLRVLAASHHERCEQLFATHADPGVYPLRALALFVAAECERGRICCDRIVAGRIEALGRLMNASHDGDRVARFPEGRGEGEPLPFGARVSDQRIEGWVHDLESQDPGRVTDAQLCYRAGGHGVSTAQIDQLVDLALATPGVHGAQLAGAGLGGCVMVLAEADAVGPLRRRLARDYYRPRKLPAAVSTCTPVEGSGLLEV
jgi:N-acetylgalactosamine kinase